MSSSNPPDSSTTKNENVTLTAVDLFSGAGGFSLGAINSGFNILAAIEYDKTACATYKKNIIEKKSPQTQIFNQDIFEIEPESFRKNLGLEKYDLDLLLGGPPCQGFSTHRINGKGIADPRNALLLRYFDFVRELGPKAFLVENVPGLLWPRHKSYLTKFKNLARRHGYKLFDPVKLNAKDFGVPQNRERVFLLGICSRLSKGKYKKSLIWPPEKTHFSPLLGKRAWETASTVFPPPPPQVVQHLLLKLGPAASKLLYCTALPNLVFDPCDIHMNHTPDLISRFVDTPIDGSRHDINFRLPCHSDDYDGHKDVYGRIKLAQPGPTITTGCINPSKGRFLHPWLPHGITPRIAARLQTFPDDFVFTGGITSQGKQIGNAVPVTLSKVLTKAIREYLVLLDQKFTQP